MSERSKFHMQLEYHQVSLARMREFLTRYEYPTTAVNVVMDTEAKQLMDKNKKVIESLLKIIILCGKQGLPLGGHRDDCVDFEHGNADSNQGNFIELVHFRAETDEVLGNHLKNAPRNALYTSKAIQNSLIDVVRQRILQDIISEVKQAQYYTIIADEVTDLSNKEQLSLTLRYVMNGRVKEVFVDFIFVERITGEVLHRQSCNGLQHGMYLIVIFVANVMTERQTWQAHGLDVWQSFSKKLQKLSIFIVLHTVSTWQLFQNVVLQLSKM